MQPPDARRELPLGAESRSTHWVRSRGGFGTHFGEPRWCSKWCSAYGNWCPKRKKPTYGRLQLLVILGLLRAGEEIRTLDVNLGKVGDPRFRPFPLDPQTTKTPRILTRGVAERS
jgi:hypothetical protein